MSIWVIPLWHIRCKCVNLKVMVDPNQNFYIYKQSTYTRALPLWWKSTFIAQRYKQTWTVILIDIIKSWHTGSRQKRSVSLQSDDRQYAGDSGSSTKYLEAQMIADQYYSQKHGDNTERDILMIAHVVSISLILLLACLLVCLLACFFLRLLVC